jgi:hypothetical protein
MSHFKVPANHATLTRLLAGSPAYLRPIIAAVRDHGVTLGFAEGQAPVKVQSDGPAIVVIGDDFKNAALGPTAFHQESILSFLDRCAAAVIVACEPLPAAYLSAANDAVLRRQNVLIVETRIEQERAWQKFIEGRRPTIRILVATVKPAGGVN